MEIDVIEIFLEEFTGKIYKKFSKDSCKCDDKILRDFLKARDPIGIYNPYSLFCMKTLDIIDKEFLKYSFFDQDEGFSPIKTPHKDGNEFISINEIYSVINELEVLPKNIKVIKQLCSRVKVLSILNTWNDSLDCEIGFNEGINYKYINECRLYFKGNKKYMRYARLLMKSLQEAKYYETPDFLPCNETEYRNFLNSTFVYVMLEPHNFIEESDFDKINIVRGIIIDGDLIPF
jgi:hypothetical protein